MAHKHPSAFYRSHHLLYFLNIQNTFNFEACLCTWHHFAQVPLELTEGLEGIAMSNLAKRTWKIFPCIVKRSDVHLWK